MSRRPIDPLGATEAGSSAETSAERSADRRELQATLDSAGQRGATLDLSALPKGLAVDRYVVLERAGEGALGVVYKAYDRELDRFVAIKLLRVRSSTPEGAEEARVRSLREAQALAKLNHPNVIAVYDVGLHGRDVFLAMAFVEGLTLSGWLAAGHRSTKEILATFLAAGDGLAAAHRAGLVHRDFKPDNVLVGEDGSVRVLDFGLARPVARREASSPDIALGVSFASGSSDSHSLPLHSDLTHEGTRVGTPLYMAPEQHLGASVDARADQFSFCVALYEALYGQHPFDAGGTVRDLVTAVTSGQVRPAPKGASVPRSLAVALKRGLARNADARFPTMEELLAALRGPTGTSRSTAMTALAAIAMAAIAGGIAYGRYERTMLCAGSDEKLAGVWDDGQRRAVSHAFLAATPGAADTLARASETLDGYARSWVKMRTDACEATRVRGEQSSEMLDLRVECLNERLQELRAQVDVFARADAKVVESAVKAAHALPRLQACADTAALRAPVRPPSDESARARVGALQATLAQGKALQRAGDYAGALAVAEKAVADAAALGYRPVEAEALYFLGDVQDDRGDYPGSEKTLRASLVAAVAGRHEAQAARTLSALVAAVGLRQARFAEGDDLAKLADAETERLSDPFIKGEVARNEGRLFVREGKYGDARAAIERCLAIWEPALGKDDYIVSGALTDLGNVYLEQGDDVKARELYSRSLEITEKVLGPDSPSLGPNLNNLGEVSVDLGEYDAAARSFERALALWKRAFGPDHPKVALALNNLSTVRREQGNADAALDLAQRALSIWKAALPPEHPDLALGMHGVAEALRAKGDYPGALAEEEQALALREKIFGPDGDDVAESLVSIGETRLAQGGASAIDPLSRALRILDARAQNPRTSAEARFDLARALAEADPPRSRALATQARADWARMNGPRAAQGIARIDAWMATHGGAP